MRSYIQILPFPFSRQQTSWFFNLSQSLDSSLAHGAMYRTLSMYADGFSVPNPWGFLILPGWANDGLLET